jgi:hypothetical protein
MKIITLHNRINTDELHNHIQQYLNPLFREQRQSDLSFNIEKTTDAIEISQPALYGEDALFKIEIKGSELWITRSEHYADDVNSLTIESILNDLFSNVSGKPGTDLLQEG